EPRRRRRVQGGGRSGGGIADEDIRERALGGRRGDEERRSPREVMRDGEGRPIRDLARPGSRVERRSQGVVQGKEGAWLSPRKRELRDRRGRHVVEARRRRWPLLREVGSLKTELLGQELRARFCRKGDERYANSEDARTNHCFVGYLARLSDVKTSRRSWFS